jgi:hypothetical protein
MSYGSPPTDRVAPGRRPLAIGPSRRTFEIMALRVKHPTVMHTVRAELIELSVLRLDGALADDSARQAVRAHLDEVHAHALANKLSALTVDVRGLAFANSSAIRLFVDMASRAQSAGYRLIFDIDSSITWHRLNFSVLQSLAPDTVVLRERGVGSAKAGS